MYDLEQSEVQQRSYPLTIAFCKLLLELVTTSGSPLRLGNPFHQVRSQSVRAFAAQFMGPDCSSLSCPLTR